MWPAVVSSALSIDAMSASSVGLERASCRDLPVEISIAQREDPVDQVAPGGDQLVVDPADDLLVAEVGVVLLGEDRGDRVSECVGLEPLGVPARSTARPRGSPSLLTVEGDVLVGGDVGGQVETPVAHQHRRPDHRVERDVVLAHEVVGLGFGVLPPPLPGLGVAAALRPLLGRRQIADDGVEPDVDPLARPESSTGISTPHSMSRVIARSGNPSSIIPSAQFLTCRRHPCLASSHSRSGSWSLGSRRK